MHDEDWSLDERFPLGRRLPYHEQSRLGGVIRAEKITDPITIPTEWFCIAFCGINWLVSTQRYP